MRELPGLEALELENRRALVRVDMNSPIEDGKVTDRARIEGASTTIRTLLDRGAGVVVLAHQGRPGSEDYTSLEDHARILGEFLRRDVQFTPHVADHAGLEAVEAVEPEDVLVLENVRGQPGETENATPSEHANRDWVRRLAGEVDVYVNDAFPASHRSHASLVGFPLLLPSAVGPLMQDEVEALERVQEAEGDRVLVLGGAKVEDALRVLAHHLEHDTIDAALLGGIIGELFLMGRGHKLGGPTESILERVHATPMLSMAEELLFRFDPRLVTPDDLGVDEGGERHNIYIEELPTKGRVLDIGPAAVERFEEYIENAETIIVNGPMGKYESPPYDEGTRAVLNAIAGSDAWTVVGGGHTVTAIDRFGIPRTSFGHVSLAGGALMTYLTGDPLPGLEALKESAHHFSVAIQDA